MEPAIPLYVLTEKLINSDMHGRISRSSSKGLDSSFQYKTQDWVIDADFASKRPSIIFTNSTSLNGAIPEVSLKVPNLKGTLTLLKPQTTTIQLHDLDYVELYGQIHIKRWDGTAADPKAPEIEWVVAMDPDADVRVESPHLPSDPTSASAVNSAFREYWRQFAALKDASYLVRVAFPKDITPDIQMCIETTADVTSGRQLFISPAANLPLQGVWSQNQNATMWLTTLGLRKSLVISGMDAARHMLYDYFRQGAERDSSAKHLKIGPTTNEDHSDRLTAKQSDTYWWDYNKFKTNGPDQYRIAMYGGFEAAITSEDTSHKLEISMNALWTLSGKVTSAKGTPHSEITTEDHRNDMASAQILLGEAVSYASRTLDFVTSSTGWAVGSLTGSPLVASFKTIDRHLGDDTVETISSTNIVEAGLVGDRARVTAETDYSSARRKIRASRIPQTLPVPVCGTSLWNMNNPRAEARDKFMVYMELTPRTGISLEDTDI